MLTNIYPIKIDFDEFNIFRVKFKSGLLDELRKNYNTEFSFFRNGDFIYISSDTEKQVNVGESLVTLKVDENEKIVSSLIKHIFFRAFRNFIPDIIPEDFYPFRFISRKHNLIESLLPQELKQKIGYSRQVEIQFRLIDIKGKPTHCAVINYAYRWVFKKNCLELREEGFDLTNLEIVQSVPIPNLDGIIAPDETSIGIVKSHSTKDKNLFLQIETNDGLNSYLASDLYLEKTRFNIDSYLNFKLGEATTRKVIQKISDEKLEQLAPKTQFEEIQGIAKTLAKMPYQNKDGFVFSISNNSILPSNSFRIYEPTFIFDDDDTQKDKNPYFGLESFGPADKTQFSPKNLNVLVVCNAKNRNNFTTFVANLSKGVPSSKYFKSGFAGKYRLHNINFEIEEIQDYKVESYKNTLRTYLKTGKKPDIVIIETKQDFRRNDVLDNPYYQIKAGLLSMAIPVQFVDNETLSLNKSSDSFLNIISLQMYAKLGGIPWVLPTKQNYDKEIVIGVGSSLQRKNKFKGNEKTKVVGITTFFSGEGRYLLGNKCSEVEYDDYFNELLTKLRDSITEISREYNWQKDSTILVIFHIFKPIKNIEAEVVEKLISEFTDYKIKYAFVTVSDRHPFSIFDQTKNQYFPEKGANLILDDFSCLLQPKSIDEIKNKKHSFPKPLLIKLIPSENVEMNFQDLNHITQQVYNFLNLSFRGFNKSKSPVTIYYSDLIASLLSRLKKIETWKPEMVNTDLKRKKWFL